MKIAIFLLLIIALQSSALAQDQKPHVTDSTKILEKKKDVTTPETPKEKKLERKLQKRLYSIPQFGHETVLFVKQPSKWIGRDWLRLGVVVIATGAVMPFDERMTNSTQG